MHIHNRSNYFLEISEYTKDWKKSIYASANEHYIIIYYELYWALMMKTNMSLNMFEHCCN